MQHKVAVRSIDSRTRPAEFVMQFLFNFLVPTFFIYKTGIFFKTVSISLGSWSNSGLVYKSSLKHYLVLSKLSINVSYYGCLIQFQYPPLYN